MAKKVTFTKESLFILCDCGYENVLSAEAVAESVIKDKGGIKCEKCGRFIPDKEIDRLGKESSMRVMKQIIKDYNEQMRRIQKMPMEELIVELQKVYEGTKLEFCSFCREGNVVFEDDNHYKCIKCGKNVWRK